MPAPTVTGSGSFGKGLVSLAYLIASTAKFQEVVGAASASAAMAFIHFSADDTGDSLQRRPRAIVNYAGYERTSVARNNFNVSAAMKMGFEFKTTIRDPENHWDELLNFTNPIETIISQMDELCGNGTGYFAGESHLDYQGIALIDGPELLCDEAPPDGDAPEEFFSANFIVTRSGL